MSSMMIAVFLALLSVPLLTLILVTPYILIKYHRDRGLSFSGCAFRYLLLCSLLASFFMTMLPFPSLEEVETITTPSVQLIPFHCFYQFFFPTEFVTSDWDAVLSGFQLHTFFSAFFNVILLMPVGFFLRALFQWDWKKVLLTGFCISLLFELIQLSGLFFLYPRPYRMFDVDDLIGNTLGSWLGYVIEPFCEPSFPPRLQNTYRSRLGGEVSFSRRLPADLFDYAIVIAASLAELNLFFADPQHPFAAVRDPRFFALFLVFYFCTSFLLAAVTFLRNGRSFGMQIFGLELRSTEDSPLTFWRCLLRTAIQDVYLILPALIGYFTYIIDDFNGLRSFFLALASAVCVISYACHLFSLFIHIVTHGEPLLFERISGTKLGLYPNARSERKLQIFYSGRLNPDSVSACTQTIYDFLLSQGFEHKKCLRVQYLAEGVLLDWMANGLTGLFFDLRYDRRFFRKALLLCAAGPQTAIALRTDDSYIELLSGTRLSFDTYFTGDMNVFSIDIP